MIYWCEKLKKTSTIHGLCVFKWEFLTPLWTSLLAGPYKPGSACCMRKKIKLLCRLFYKSFAEVWSGVCSVISCQSGSPFWAFPICQRRTWWWSSSCWNWKDLIDRRKKEHPIVVAWHVRPFNIWYSGPSVIWDLRSVPKTGRLSEQVENQERVCTQVLFLSKGELGFFDLLEIVTSWLIPSSGQKIPV